MSIVLKTVYFGKSDDFIVLNTALIQFKYKKQNIKEKFNQNNKNLLTNFRIIFINIKTIINLNELKIKNSMNYYNSFFDVIDNFIILVLKLALTTQVDNIQNGTCTNKT